SQKFVVHSFCVLALFIFDFLVNLTKLTVDFFDFGFCLFCSRQVIAVRKCLFLYLFALFFKCLFIGKQVAQLFRSCVHYIPSNSSNIFSASAFSASASASRSSFSCAASRSPVVATVCGYAGIGVSVISYRLPMRIMVSVFVS